MESENAYIEEKDHIKSSSSDSSSRVSVEDEKNENVFRNIGSFDERKREYSDHRADEISDSDSENSHKMIYTTDEFLDAKKESYSDSESPKTRSTSDTEEKKNVSDSEPPNEMISSTNEEHVKKESDSDESPNKMRTTLEKTESLSVSNSDSLNKMVHATNEVYVMNKDINSDSESPHKKTFTTIQVSVVNKESDSDSESPNKMIHTTDEVQAPKKESDSDTESPHKMIQSTNEVHAVKRGSDSETEGPNKVIHTTNEVHVDKKESDSDTDSLNNARMTSYKVEGESGSDSKSLNKMIHDTGEIYIVKEDSDSDTGNLDHVRMNSNEVARGNESAFDSPSNMTYAFPNKTSTSVNVVVQDVDSDSDNDKKLSYAHDKIIIGDEESYSGSDNFKKLRHAQDKIVIEEKEGDSESKSLNNMSHAIEGVFIDKELDLDFMNLSKNNHTDENIGKAVDSDSEDTNKTSYISENVHIINEYSGSDSGSPNQIKHPTFHVLEKSENNSDSDSEKNSKINEITKNVLIEEKEVGLASEDNTILSQIVEIVEIKEVDPVFDGTESLEIDTRSIPSSSYNQLSENLDSNSNNSWPAIKNLVRIKGAIAVTNVFRRLSGGKDEAGPADEEEKNAIVEGTIEPIMKGRIILYTRLGCQESKKIRSFLHQQGLNITEINVDIYPGRKLELEKNTGSSAVPRLYLNDYVVGGLRELMEMVGSGKFDEQIKIVKKYEPSSDAPLPPFPGEDDVSTTGKVDELASIVKRMKDSIVLSDRFYKLRRFNSCFVGSEALDFLSKDQELEREEAVNLGRKLVKGLFFRHVLDENVFEDGNHLYRFLEHDPSISTNCYNMTRGLNELKPKRVTEIASRLRFLSFAIFEAYASEDGNHVDYKNIQNSEEFRRYMRIIQELQRVDMDNISREEKLAFFINLYNMMAIHAILTWGYPNGAADRKKLLGEFKYVVGGSPYSLSAIQNGILRGNQRPPYNLSKPFGPKDARFKVALPYVEPLVHFALSCGTKSGPPLKCYSPGNIDMELMESARIFLRNGGLLVDAETKTASASSIIKWYSVDFGKNETEIMKHLSNYLEPSKSQELLDLLAVNQLRVTYQPYDWGCNC